MKLHIIKYLCLIFCIPACLSCKKFLDIEPIGYSIPQTTTDFEQLLNNVGLIRPFTRDIEYLSDDAFFFGFKKDMFNTHDQAVYGWIPYRYANENDYAVSPWSIIYQNIYQYNVVINGIPKTDTGSDAERRSLLAQARTGRALMYYYLVNLYSKVYDKNTAQQDLGVPIILQNDINHKINGRETVQKVYDFILDELNQAIPHLSPDITSPYQLSQPAGYGILARTYLMMGNFAEAMKATDKVLVSKNEVIDYNTIITNTSGNVERYSYKFGALPSAAANPENIYIIAYHTPDPNGSVSMSNPQIAFSPGLTSLLNKNDLRRVFFSRLFAEDDYWWDKNLSYFSPRNFDGPFSLGITVPELLLIRAECNARLGNLDLALTDLNKLQKNRTFSTAYVPVVSTDQRVVTQMVLDERRRELFYRAARWFDMRRLSADPDFGFTAVHYYNDNSVIELKPNSSRYQLDIPNNAVSTTVVQNPF